MKKPELPIEIIGEENWVNKLTKFLEEYDVDVQELDDIDCAFDLPENMRDYYKAFGGVASSDFMYNLYSPKDFIKLSESHWSFLVDNFSNEEIENCIVFSQSPGNDPVCLNTDDNFIYLFSHDPLKKVRVFDDFNQFLRYEIIEIQKLMGDVEWTKEEEIEYQEEWLNVKDLDYSFRYMKFC